MKRRRELSVPAIYFVSLLILAKDFKDIDAAQVCFFLSFVLGYCRFWGIK